MRRDSGTGGFTLIEVTVALVIGGLALAGAAALLSVLGGRADALDAAAARVDHDANGERLLRALLGNLAFSTDSTLSLQGDRRSVTFRSWCDGAGGWLEPCRVRLALDSSNTGFTLRLELTNLPGRRGTVRGVTQALIVRGGLRTAGFRYLVDAGRGGTWAESWSRVVVPPAIAVILGRDTLLLPVWGNG